MATRYPFLLPTIFACWLAACTSAEEVNSAVMIPGAQAAESTRSLYPPLAPDADPGGQVYEYH